MNTPAAAESTVTPIPLASHCRIDHRALWLTAAVLLAAGVPGTWAQPASESADTQLLKQMTLEELLQIKVATVTTASKRPEKATEAPGTVIVIDARDIRMRGYSCLKDVLRDLPGMETIEYFFSEFGTQVPVRGISGNNKIVVLVNGMRVNPPGGANFPFRSDFSVRQAERIEVIYGPGSTLYGQDAISAVINIITRTPAEGNFAEGGVAGGLNEEREAWGSFGGILDKDGKVRLTGYIQYHDSDLTRLDKEYPAWWESYRALAAPRGSGVTPYRQDYGLNAFARLEFYDASIQVWRRESRRSSSEGGYPPAYVKEARWQDSETVAEGKHTLALSDSVKLDSAITYNRYEINPASRYVFNVPNLNDQWFLNDFKYGIGQGGTIEETLRKDVSKDVSILGGIMAGTFDVIPKSTIPGGADPNGDLVAQGGGWTYTIGTDPTPYRVNRVVESTYQTYAAYAEANWRVVDSLKLIAGTRVTKDTRFDDTPFTPRVALIYNLTPELAVKYIYTRAYVAPAPYFANATYDNGTLLATANPNLDPEKAETHEINLSYERKNLSLGMSLYAGQQKDIIMVSDRGLPQNILSTDAYLDGDPSQRRTLVHTANGGCGERYGADLYGRATIGDISLWTSYSYVDSTETMGDMETGLTGISRHNGRLGMTWAPFSKLFITPSLVIRSTPENVPPGALADEVKVPWEVNLHVLYQATRHVEYFADVRNLTDHHYALGGFGEGNRAIPQETLHGMIGLRASF